MSYKNRMLYRFWFGVIVLLVVCVIAKEVGFLDVLMVEIYVPIIPLFTATLVTGLLAFGIFLVVQSLRELLFECVGEPNYEYDEENKQIFVRFTSTDFKITRGEINVCLKMLFLKNYFTRPLYVYEVYGLSVTPFSKIISGTSESNKFVTSNGQVLHFKRYWTGIMITWEEDGNPWKIVEEK